MDPVPYDDRDGMIWLDGHLVPWREAKLHVLSHALHYASSVFEGERVYGGKIFKLEEHSKRLLRSADLLDIRLGLTVQEINEACQKTVQANGIANKDGYVRPLAWRGSEMMGVSAQKAKIHFAVACWEWPAYFAPEEKMQGIRMEFSQYRRPDPGPRPFTVNPPACT